MARDNSPQDRQKRQLERKVGRRAGYDRILIVTEGSKTEPNYFNEIRSTFRLHTANVEVRHSEFGTSPLQVVEYAKELFEHGDKHRGLPARAFEKVYAIFDRDEHASYFEALTLAERINGALRNDAKHYITFGAIASVPSFELWILLHFEEIHGAIPREEVLRRVKKHIPGYEKGAAGIYARTLHNMAVAMRRAESLADRFDARSAPEPFTSIHTLVNILTTLKL